MMRGSLTVLAFISVILFPWPLTVLLALAASVYVPLVPLAAGLFYDTLYYAPQAGLLPLFTIFGALVSAIAIFVRSRLSEGII
jgi:hypothetical protein